MICYRNIEESEIGGVTENNILEIVTLIACRVKTYSKDTLLVICSNLG